MSKLPTRTTRRHSVTVADETTDESLDLDVVQSKHGGRSYVLESASFGAQLEQQKRDQIALIERLDQEMQGIGSRILFLQAELTARSEHRADAQIIVDQINAARAVVVQIEQTSSPKLEVRKS